MSDLPNNTILHNAKRHFATRRAALGRVEVPEWAEEGEPPVLIYYRPLNLAEQARIDDAARNGPRLEAIAEQVLICALDENGKRLFRDIERGELLRDVDPEILNRIVRTMNRDSLTNEEIEKN